MGCYFLLQGIFLSQAGIKPTPPVLQADSLSADLSTVVVVLVTQLCLTLCDPMDCGPPGSSVHGILQARILEWIAISFSRGSSQPRDRTHTSCITGGFFTAEPSGKSNPIN